MTKNFICLLTSHPILRKKKIEDGELKIFFGLQGIYVTHVYENGPAHHAALQVHDKILQVLKSPFSTQCKLFVHPVYFSAM